MQRSDFDVNRIGDAVARSIRFGLTAIALVCCVPCQLVATPFDKAAAVLAKNCLQCHNDVDRDGDFSVQTANSLFESGFVQPGELSSHLLAVVQTDGDQPPSMPKDASPLADADVAALKHWIKAGAPWPDDARIEVPKIDFDWWSFGTLSRPSVPETKDPWIRTPIDAFVWRRLQANQLSPSADADRRTLIRRVTYDLIGLPPTPAEIDQFVASSDPAAYEKLVDRLLPSKHYGERWARHWLDIVKYADTCGYDKDKLRPNAWPYRDYVIRSLNDDKSYQRFVQEQIAGDVLFPGHPDGLLGLGFIAAGPWDFIGHVEVPESKIDGQVARNLDRDDMLSNTLNTFCSVTIQCARCHDHKFDPFTQEHYYSLQAIFAAVDRADRVYQSDPQAELQRSRLQDKLDQYQRQLDHLNEGFAASGGDRLQTLDQRIKEVNEQVGVRKEPEYGYHSALSDQQTATKWVEVDLGNEAKLSSIVLHPCHDEFGWNRSRFWVSHPLRGRSQRWRYLARTLSSRSRLYQSRACPGDH